MRSLLPITAWRIDVAGPDDDPVLRGTVAGAPHVSAPLEALLPDDQYARGNDGTEYALGEPDATTGRAPAALPRDALARRLCRARAALARIRAGDLPGESELAAAPRLDAWLVLPDAPGPVLLGIVEGHPRIRDGAQITTSPLLWLADDRRAARTVSRWYRLGDRLDIAIADPSDARDDG